MNGKSNWKVAFIPRPHNVKTGKVFHLNWIFHSLTIVLFLLLIGPQHNIFISWFEWYCFNFKLCYQTRAMTIDHYRLIVNIKLQNKYFWEIKTGQMFFWNMRWTKHSKMKFVWLIHLRCLVRCSSLCFWQLPTRINSCHLW